MYSPHDETNNETREAKLKNSRLKKVPINFNTRFLKIYFNYIENLLPLVSMNMIKDLLG